MHKKEIEEYIDSHRQEMLDDICKLCRINSEKCRMKKANLMELGHLMR